MYRKINLRLIKTYETYKFVHFSDFSLIIAFFLVKCWILFKTSENPTNETICEGLFG